MTISVASSRRHAYAQETGNQLCVAAAASICQTAIFWLELYLYQEDLREMLNPNSEPLARHKAEASA